ncbi:DUF2992 family protein [bacterium 210820-DFI.6.37]|nr:DUF2992 family protein [bacterium 210820-DFI.6.37]
MKWYFGSEPSEVRVYEFVLKNGRKQQYSPAVEAVVKEAKNPKRTRGNRLKALLSGLCRIQNC